MKAILFVLSLCLILIAADQIKARQVLAAEDVQAHILQGKLNRLRQLKQAAARNAGEKDDMPTVNSYPTRSLGPNLTTGPVGHFNGVPKVR